MSCEEQQNRELGEKDVEDYYAQRLNFSSQACTAKQKSRFCGEIGKIMDMLHPDVVSRYYGCGLVVPDLLKGLHVVDLGCGTGVDCFLLSKLVGANGSVVGIDMTQEQLSMAEKYNVYHSEKFGYNQPNIRFTKCFIEDLKPAGIEDSTKDLVVSNCVISLSFSKEAVFRDAARVLKPGGELFFSDMYCNKQVPENLKKDQVLWGEGFGGALHWEELCRIADAVGFCVPVMHDNEDLKYQNEEIRKQIPSDLRYKAVTYRLFKRGPQKEDASVLVKMTYLGGIDGTCSDFRLTAKIQLKKGDSVLVPKQLAEALKVSRYGEYIEVGGPVSNTESANFQTLQQHSAFV